MTVPESWHEVAENGQWLGVKSVTANKRQDCVKSVCCLLVVSEQLVYKGRTQRMMQIRIRALEHLLRSIATKSFFFELHGELIRQVSHREPLWVTLPGFIRL